jgi:hypothetical protein
VVKLGQHPREINPYWKKGGRGLPSQRTTEKGNKFLCGTSVIFFHVLMNKYAKDVSGD